MLLHPTFVLSFPRTPMQNKRLLLLYERTRAECVIIMVANMQGIVVINCKWCSQANRYFSCVRNNMKSCFACCAEKNGYSCSHCAAVHQSTRDISLCLLPIVSVCFIVLVVSGLFLSLLLRHSCVSQVLTPRMSLTLTKARKSSMNCLVATSAWKAAPQFFTQASRTSTLET